jgi:glycosyltransferase involved in cell wall biosynthesis
MDGIGWFTYNTLKEITVSNPAIEFHFLFDSGIDASFLFSKNVIPHNLFPPARHAVLNIIWFEWSVKKILKKIDPDLFFSPDGILCLGWNGKQHGVIHDINFYHHPEDLKFSNRKYYNYLFPRYANKATRLATVSEYSKFDIAKSFEINQDKIDVVYNGINSFYHPASENIINQTRDRYTNGKPFFIFVGTISPRKNLLNLMNAFELYKRETNSDTKLAIAGGGMYKVGQLHDLKKQLQFGGDIIFTGRLGDTELNDVLGSALALIYVPKFEGFGIPLVEAMQCNIPIIASSVTSIPEVTGNAALLVDPFDVDEIKNALVKIETDQTLRNELIERGKSRKEFFSWRKTADLLWASINKCL